MVCGLTCCLVWLDLVLVYAVWFVFGLLRLPDDCLLWLLILCFTIGFVCLDAGVCLVIWCLLFVFATLVFSFTALLSDGWMGLVGGFG